MESFYRTYEQIMTSSVPSHPEEQERKESLDDIMAQFRVNTKSFIALSRSCKVIWKKILTIGKKFSRRSTYMRKIQASKRKNQASLSGHTIIMKSLP